MRWVGVPSVHTNHRPHVEVIGLCDQQYYIRQPRPEDEPKHHSQKRKGRPRESQLWQQATQRIGPKVQDATVRWVRVCDRGADIYEHLQACTDAGHGFVVRASQDRALVQTQEENGGARLLETARLAPVLGQFPLELRARSGQRARNIHLLVSATRVLLQAPQRPGHGSGVAAPIACSVVRVWENRACKSRASVESQLPSEALEWVLLCDQEIKTWEQAHQCALQYATRWFIEQFHKALKSGLGVERLQLKTADRLFAAIAIMSVVAVRLLDLREQLAVAPLKPAHTCMLDPLELEVLRQKTKRKLETVHDVALALGRLGGHLNRSSDGCPGWQTLWRGMRQLQTLVDGVKLAKRLTPEFG